VQQQITFMRPIFVAAWSCVSILAIWQIKVGRSDTSAVMVAAAVLLASLLLSSFGLHLPITTAPMLYLILLGLFHLGLVVPWVLGAYDINRVPWFTPYGLSRALALITYSLLAYQFGLLAALRGEAFSDDSTVEHEWKFQDSKLFAVGNSLFLLGALMFVVGLIQLDPVGYYKLTYYDTFRLRAESDPRLFGAGIMFASIGSCLAVAGAPKRKLWFTFLSTGTWAFILFYLGFRGPAIIICLVVYTLSLKKGIEFPRWFPWLCFVLLLVAIPIIGMVRDEPLNDRTFDNSINILDAPAEMGQSIRPLIETESLIGPTDYRHGKTYLIALKSIIPNLAFRWQASSTEVLDDLPPSQWITALADPWTYKNYGGMGFSAIAEPYMNFGVAGVVGYFLLLAYALVRLEQVSIRSSYALATWGLILGPMLWTTRNDSSNFFRPVVWGLLLLAVLWICSTGISFLARKKRDGKLMFDSKRV
jgi:oligosaccharide repeat unit polymerase